MSDAPACARCAREIRHDTALVCGRCASHLRADLHRTAGLEDDVQTTIARLDRVTRGPSQPDPDPWESHGMALEAVPLIVNLDAAQAYQAAVGELSTWARHCAEERGIEPVSVALSGLCASLAGQVDWLRYRDEADEAFAALGDACKAIRRIVDARPEGKLVCMCQCGVRLYAQGHEAAVSCGDCGTVYDVGEARADLLAQGRQLTVTPAEAADLIAGWLEPGADRQRVRKLVGQWAHRGLVDVDEDGRCELGQVLDRWAKALAARVA